MSLYTTDSNGQIWQVDVNPTGGFTETAVASVPAPSGTGADIIKNALFEIGALGQSESPTTDEYSFCLGKLNRIWDSWNAEGLFLSATQLSQFTLTPNKNPHTIGLAANTPDFAVTTNRPVRIEAANLVLTDVTPNIFRPLKLVDDTWWMNNPVPTLATQIPYYCYYNAGWPNGQVYLWPVPTTAYDIRFLLSVAIAQLASTSDTVSLPPGYSQAITLTLAEQLAGPFDMPLPPMLPQLAADARARIKSVNSVADAMQCDGGVQSMNSRPRASIANFLSGFFN